MRVPPLTALLLAAALTATAATAAGCGLASDGSRVCAVAGCDDGVAFDLQGLDAPGTEELAVLTCLGDACRTQVFEAVADDAPRLAPLVLRTAPPGTFEPGQRLPVRVEVTSADGRQVLAHDETVTLEAHHPNGPDCPPTCAQATMRPAAPVPAP